MGVDMCVLQERARGLVEFAWVGEVKERFVHGCWFGSLTEEGGRGTQPLVRTLELVARACVLVSTRLCFMAFASPCSGCCAHWSSHVFRPSILVHVPRPHSTDRRTAGSTRGGGAFNQLVVIGPLCPGWVCTPSELLRVHFSERPL